MVVRLTKYPNTVLESSLTFMKANNANNALHPKALYGTPRLSVLARKAGAFPSLAKP